MAIDPLPWANPGPLPIGPMAPAGLPAIAEVVRGVPALAALRGEWDTLVRASDPPSPFLLHDWIEHWRRAHAPESEPVLVVARRGGRLCAGLPLLVTAGNSLRTGWLPGGFTSQRTDLLALPGDALAARAVVEALPLVGVDLLRGFGVRAGSRLAEAVPDAQLLERSRVPVLHMPHGWTVARAQVLSRGHRKQAARRLRRLAEHGAVSFEVAADASATRAVLDEVVRLHVARWQGRPDRSGFATERGRAFHAAALPALAEAGHARIAVLRVDGRAIAFDCWLTVGGWCYGYRCAFDPAFAAYSPGRQIMFAAFDRADAEGMSSYDFGQEEHDYKVRLATAVEPIYELVGPAFTPRGRAAASLRATAVAVRSGLRRHPLAHRAYVAAISLRARRSGR